MNRERSLHGEQCTVMHRDRLRIETQGGMETPQAEAVIPKQL